jgi:hypothetical protein
MEPIKHTIANTSSVTPVTNKENQLNINASPSNCLLKQQENIRNHFQNAIINKNSPLFIPNISYDEFPEEIVYDTLQMQFKAVQEYISDKKELLVAIAGNKNQCSDAIISQLRVSHKTDISKFEKDSVDIVLAPHSLYNQMSSIFQATEKLLKNDGSFTIDEHPLFPYFASLKEDGHFVATFKSGPDISSFTDILLKKHNFSEEVSFSKGEFDISLFNNAETFLRCMDIFKDSFESAVGKTIQIDLSYSMSHQPLESFCRRYINQYPELRELSQEESKKFIKLLSVFNIENDIVDMNITLKMSVKPLSIDNRSFLPINQHHEDIHKGSNELTEGQQGKRQLQNLNGSDTAMRYIKDADGRAQIDALQPVLGRKHLKIVDIAGGRGETNGVMNALREAGSNIQLLNIEPDVLFKDPYIKAHQSLGIDDVSVLPLKMQQLTVNDVTGHFGEDVDVVFASHAFYFIIEDMFKASLNPDMPLDEHPMTKYFAMLKKNGFLSVTMQCGAGARLFRNAILVNHGLNSISK